MTSELADEVHILNEKLKAVFDRVAQFDVETDGLENALTTCNNTFLNLEKHRRAHPDNDPDGHIEFVIGLLRTVRIELAPLRDIRKTFESDKGNRPPKSFYRQCGLVEQAISPLLPHLTALERELRGTGGHRAHGAQWHESITMRISDPDERTA